MFAGLGLSHYLAYFYRLLRLRFQRCTHRPTGKQPSRPGGQFAGVAVYKIDSWLQPAPSVNRAAQDNRFIAVDVGIRLNVLDISFEAPTHQNPGDTISNILSTAMLTGYRHQHFGVLHITGHSTLAVLLTSHSRQP